MASAAETSPVPGNWHEEALRISSSLTLHFRQKYQRKAVMVTPEDVIQVLTKVGADFVLMGTYGVEGYRTEPRATQDVDVLVRKKDLRKAVTALTAQYPSLTVQDAVVVTRFLDPDTGQPVIDVMKPEQPVFKMVFRNTVTVDGKYKIPNLEMALVSKFAAMTSPNRSYDKKLIDGGDFVNIVKKNIAALDRKRLRRLVGKLYPTAADEISEMVENIKAGRRIEF